MKEQYREADTAHKVGNIKKTCVMKYFNCVLDPNTLNLYPDPG